jgi:hypothetical protein
MRLVLHPKIYSDIAQVMEYYEQVASADLADEFYAELQQLMREAATRPEAFAEPTCAGSRIIFCFV